jgi:hypothetical protein
MNYFSEIMCEGVSNSRFVEDVGPTFAEALVPLLQRSNSQHITAVDSHQFGVDISGFQSFESEEPDHSPLFHSGFDVNYVRSKFQTRVISSLRDGMK